jgi:pyruvate kinase
MELVVRKVTGSEIEAEVVRGGILYSRKAVNAPQTELTTSGLTEKDIADVRFALEEGVDYIALSFVQSGADVRKIKEIAGQVPVIAKIESAVGLRHMEEIVREADGIMVARGDLGVEVPIEQVPYVQKHLIRSAIWHGKPSIVATQTLTSMIDHPRPTRAEVSDIANAVWDGADAVMLSDETAAGRYPVEALETLGRVVREAEQSLLHRENRL